MRPSRPVALVLAALAAVAFALVMSGCGSAGPDRPNAAASLVLDSRPDAADAGISLALAREFDEAEGVTLRERSPAAPGDGLRRLLAGRATFAILDLHDLAIAHDRGRDVVGVMAVVQRPLAAVVAAPAIRRPRDLDGQRVAVGAGPRDTAILDAIVAHDGGDPRRVATVRVRAGGGPSTLVVGRVAAFTGSWATDGLAVLHRLPRARTFRADDAGAPAYPELVLCTTRATLGDERPVVRATVAALRRGYEEALADPDSAIEAIVDRAPGADRIALEDGFDAVSPAFLEGVARHRGLRSISIRERPS